MSPEQKQTRRRQLPIPRSATEILSIFHESKNYYFGSKGVPDPTDPAPGRERFYRGGFYKTQQIYEGYNFETDPDRDNH